MGKKGLLFMALFLSALFISTPSIAHFGMLIPSDEMIMKGENPHITLRLMFWHPFEGKGMEMEKPDAFGVVAGGRKTSLLHAIRPLKIKGHLAWVSRFRIKRPGVYMFYMEPKPYWEAEEECYIIHYTKTVIASFGREEGWDQPIGLKTEIVPLSRPFGLYAGNVFQGVVLLDGKPVPNAAVEVERFNEGEKYRAPTDYMYTQTLRADRNGVFTYGAPKAGWWGFAALNRGDRKLQGKDVELGAVIWVKFYDMK